MLSRTLFVVSHSNRRLFKNHSAVLRDVLVVRKRNGASKNVRIPFQAESLQRVGIAKHVVCYFVALGQGVAYRVRFCHRKTAGRLPPTVGLHTDPTIRHCP